MTDLKKSIANQAKDSLNMEISPLQARYGDIVTNRGVQESAKNGSQSVTMNIDTRPILKQRMKVPVDIILYNPEFLHHY